MIQCLFLCVCVACGRVCVCGVWACVCVCVRVCVGVTCGRDVWAWRVGGGVFSYTHDNDRRCPLTNLCPWLSPTLALKVKGEWVSAGSQTLPHPIILPSLFPFLFSVVHSPPSPVSLSAFSCSLCF